jgi:hypothetical protein
MKLQKVRTKAQNIRLESGFEIGGLLGNRPYLLFENKNGYLGILSGAPLYRLAKAIVRRFEEDVR